MNDAKFSNDSYKLQQVKSAADKWENGLIDSERLAEMVYGLTNKGNVSVPKEPKDFNL